jgi:hypothetical protein
MQLGTEELHQASSSAARSAVAFYWTIGTWASLYLWPWVLLLTLCTNIILHKTIAQFNNLHAALKSQPQKPLGPTRRPV